MRTQKEIDQEYTNLAANYGDKMFKIEVLSADAKKIFSRLCELNKEAASALNAPASMEMDMAPVADIPVLDGGPPADEHEIQ